MIKHYPNIYDGEILVLDDYSVENSALKLMMRSIRFSQLATLVNHGLSLPESLGSLGFQAIVTDSDKTYLLVGKRDNSSDYKPGFLTLPGGMFETRDARSSIKTACLRELREEIDLPLKEQSMVTIALLGEANNTGCVILIEIETSMKLRLSEIESSTVAGNEEWEGNKLWWLPFTEVRKLDSTRILEGLTYVQKHLHQALRDS